MYLVFISCFFIFVGNEKVFNEKRLKLFVVFELKYLEDYIRERVVFSVRLKLFKYMFFVIICIFEVEIKFFNNN